MKKRSFDNFIESELSFGEKKSIKGGLLPGGTTGGGLELDPLDPVDPTEPSDPQNAGPIIITSGTTSGHVKFTVPNPDPIKP